MASFIKPVVLLCLFSCLLQQSVLADVGEPTWDSQLPGNQFRGGYKVIDQFLAAKVGPSETMAGNLDALMAKANSGDFNDREVKVAQKLDGLRTTVESCDQVSYECLDDNDEATDYKSHDVEQNPTPTRIEQIIYYYGRQHATTCQKKLESSFKPLWEQIDSQDLARLSIWLDPIIDRTIAGSHSQTNDDFSDKVFHELIKDFYLNKAISDHKHAYNVIKTLVKDNPDEERYLHYYTDEVTGERHFQREKFHELIEKYFEAPCNAYLGQMGELFKRADIDARFHHDVNSSNPLFYRGWAYNKICSSLFDRSYQALLFVHLKVHAKQIADNEEDAKLKTVH